MQPEPIRLTQYSHGAGCGCKIAPSVLQEILHGSSESTAFPQLLVGNGHNDDAAVYDLGNGTALIATTDFFSPIVDDAFDYGRIAAANAISDVYAMGGRPLLALAVLGWPVDKLPAGLARQVLEGARATCAAAGIPLAGGHSIDAPEPFFGLAVNGNVERTRLKRNNTALEGDLLYLTKPLGVGILSTARKRGVLEPAHEGLAEAQMLQLNDSGPLLAALEGVTALTDVTGFGLLGHLLEMAGGSGLSAELHYNRIPVLEAARGYLAQRIVPDATYRNWNSYSNRVGFAKDVNVLEAFNLLPDPQTNGGLLIAVRPAAAPAVEALLRERHPAVAATPIGQLTAAGEKEVNVLP
ncbi:MAG TPA: selenide, water dikinase SelD [Lacibacter sp.]|nr:selenide, water dikinase SelD [Lacibacter sp.]HMO90139.1 selenide, water dikinase SelD [Lacibacter sp.]